MVYGALIGDWGEAFILGVLLVLCLALLLSLVVGYQYIGLEKIIDDEIAHRTKTYKYHPGHFRVDEMGA